MSEVRTDYSIQSANTPSRSNLAKARAGGGDVMLKCMILRVRYVDDPENVTQKAQNPQITYDVIVLTGTQEGQIINNVRAAAMVAGQYNYSELVFRKASRPVSGPGAVPISQQDGDFVYVAFENGNPSLPIIVGSAKHILDATNTGAAQADGPRWLMAYNGVVTSVDKDGQYSVKRQGGTYDAGLDAFKPVAGGNEAELKLTPNKLTLTAKTVSGQAAVKEELDGSVETLTITMKSGIVVTIDGINDKVLIQSKGGAKVSVDGKADSIEAKDKSGAGLKVSGGKVALGASSLELVDALSQTLNLLATDLGNLGYLLANSAQYATLKAKVDAIKGAL